jgi:Tfp pilus assembly protein PilN
VALDTSNELYQLLYDMSAGMEQITALENLLKTPVGDGESVTNRDHIREQMEAIQQGLAERRQRIEQLEQQLRQQKGATSQVKKQIAQLREQIDRQAETVESLRSQLEAANIQIDSLGRTINTLHNTVDTISASRDRKEAERKAAVDELHTVYYVIGTNKELKSHNIIEGGGFLRKTKILPSDFDRSYMQRGDRRNIVEIPLDSKKAKVMTPQPSDAYQISTKSNGTKVLRITDPDKFWATTNILVVQVD